MISVLLFFGFLCTWDDHLYFPIQIFREMSVMLYFYQILKKSPFSFRKEIPFSNIQISYLEINSAFSNFV